MTLTLILLICPAWASTPDPTLPDRGVSRLTGPSLAADHLSCLGAGTRPFDDSPAPRPAITGILRNERRAGPAGETPASLTDDSPVPGPVRPAYTTGHIHTCSLDEVAPAAEAGGMLRVASVRLRSQQPAGALKQRHAVGRFGAARLPATHVVTAAYTVGPVETYPKGEGSMVTRFRPERKGKPTRLHVIQTAAPRQENKHAYLVSEQPSVATAPQQAAPT
jgi:hypothetical protein